MLPYTIFLLLLLYNGVFAGNDLVKTKEMEEAEQQMAKQILAFIEHYKQEDPIGMPGAKIPDPMSVPKMKRSFTVATMTFDNINVIGLSKFRLIYVKSEMASMEVHAAMKLDRLFIKGNYTMSTWISRSAGPFIVDLTDVYVKGLANLAVERNGQLRAQDINMDITFGSISLNFENLGFMASIFQNIINSVGTFLFDSIKPFVLSEAYTEIRKEVNNNLEKFVGDVQFPNSLSPLDMVLADTRDKIRGMKLDPFHLKDYTYVTRFYKAVLSETWLLGLSSFYRIGNISLNMENNTLISDFEIGSRNFEGKTEWQIGFLAGLANVEGTASFTVEYLSARVIFAQPLDTRKRPRCRDIQLEIGNIQARCDGAGTVDYALEVMVNILPNILRYQIMDAIEGPIREQFQKQFNRIDVEATIKNQMNNIKSMQMPNLKDIDNMPMMHLKYQDEPEEPEVVVPNEIEDVDEFWKFD